LAILTNNEILNRIESHDIIIQPFDQKNLGANSYDLTLSEEVKQIVHPMVDVGQKTEIFKFKITDDICVLEPNEIYLLSTNEYTETHNLVPMIMSRSSMARDGINLILNAGFGDIGYCGKWTVPCFVLKPTKIKAGIRFCQIFYNTVEGKITETYKGKYQNTREPQTSKLYSEF
jgi:dCTP deaminase